MTSRLSAVHSTLLQRRWLGWDKGAAATCRVGRSAAAAVLLPISDVRLRPWNGQVRDAGCLHLTAAVHTTRSTKHIGGNTHQDAART